MNRSDDDAAPDPTTDTPAGPRTSDRERLRELLQAHHRFPGEYHLSIIAHNRVELVVRLRSVIEIDLLAPLADTDWETRASGQGRYASHRVRVTCRDAEHVLEIYARLHTVEGVISLM